MNNSFVGNESNLMVWSEGESPITQTISTGGRLADLIQWPANGLPVLLHSWGNTKERERGES